ncbi:flippase-like domain-containing protein [Candidatus Saccharibacteria bacterium]|nr:flippase-like domain-containing protein [Candidatus Saccharibacteria bacterium]
MTSSDKNAERGRKVFGVFRSAHPRTKKQKIRKAIMIAIFVTINVAVIVATAVAEFGNSGEAAELAEVQLNWWLLIPAAVIFVAAMWLDIYKYVLLLKRTVGKGKFERGEEWRLARRTVIFGKYYDNITPAAVGGQPFQIYYMHKNGRVPSGLATTIPIIGMITGQIGFLILALVCFLVGGMRGNILLGVTAWIGLAVYAFWPVMVLISMLLPKTMTRIINFVVNMLARVKIVKNPVEAKQRIEYEVREYAKSVKAILKNKGLFGEAVLLMVLYYILMMSIPFFVLTAFGGDVGYFETLSTTVAVTAAVYFVPTPGNSGAAEGTFFAVFSSLSTGYVFWAMLVWRFFSYYIYIIMGPVTYFLMNLEKRKKV